VAHRDGEPTATDSECGNIIIIITDVSWELKFAEKFTNQFF
jgi:hypothetical protein